MGSVFAHRKDGRRLQKDLRVTRHTDRSNAARIGCAGWSIPAAQAKRLAGPGSHLERYSRYFNAVEINSTFYRSHQPETYRRWAECVPSDFRFSVKLPRTISHFARLQNSADDLRAFLDGVQELGDKLGPILVQLPPSLAFSAGTVGAFLAEFRNVYSGMICIEPRHVSWFEDSVDAMLCQYTVARVGADPALIPAAFSPGGHPSLCYLRLHGSPKMYYSAYDETFLMRVAESLRGCMQSGPSAWCVFDNTAHGAAIPNASELIQLLQGGAASAPCTVQGAAGINANAAGGGFHHHQGGSSMSRSPNSALTLLIADHREVDQLFQEFEDADGNATKQAVLASKIGQALTIHAELEETLRYPRVLAQAKKQDDALDLVCEATVEHGTLRGLISDMNGKSPSDPMVKAHVKVLKEYVQHHVREEEKEFFPKIEDMQFDLDAIGEEMATLKRSLLEAAGPAPTGSSIRIVDVKADTRRLRAA